MLTDFSPLIFYPSGLFFFPRLFPLSFTPRALSLPPFLPPPFPLASFTPFMLPLCSVLPSLQPLLYHFLSWRCGIFLFFYSFFAWYHRIFKMFRNLSQSSWRYSQRNCQAPSELLLLVQFCRTVGMFGEINHFRWELQQKRVIFRRPLYLLT